MPTPKPAFSLAEVLIALGLIAVVAAFAIPKLLQAQSQTAQNTQALEVASMISQAYQRAKLDNAVGDYFTQAELLPYFNAVSVDTTSVIDWTPTLDSVTCSATTPCLRLYGSGILALGDGTAKTFIPNVPLSHLPFIFDPDGRYSGSTADSPGKSVQFLIYNNGAITTRGYPKAGSQNSSGIITPDPNMDPSWFHWN